MKKISIVFVIAGLCFIIAGGFQLLKMKHAQGESLAEAQALLSNRENAPVTHDILSSSKQNGNTEIFTPAMGETVGLLHIPKLERDLPIVEGTDEDELAKGVGHYQGTAYPTQNDQIVLSGHRDTVFRRMGELKLGDVMTVQLSYGDFSYEIVDTKIVDAGDRTIIAPTAPDEVLTVTTCYPFSYIGNAPDRYIITALPIDKPEK